MAPVQEAMSHRSSCPYARVYLEITNVCNLRCSFCHGTCRRGEFMSRERFITALDRLAGFTEYVYFHLMGEPLLHPELAEFVSIAANRGFKPCITTNGTLLPKAGDALIRSGVYKVNISVHSSETDSDIRSAYLDGCLDFADRASANGVLTVLRLWNRGVDGGLNASVLTSLQARFPEPWARSPHSDGIRLRPKLHLEYGDRFDWPDMEGEDLGERSFCYGLADHFGVLVDGTVVPCCLDADGAVNLGNLFDTSLDSILSSDRAVAIREGFKRKICSEELCRRCGYSRRFKL